MSSKALSIVNVEYPALYETMRAVIAACREIDECKAIKDRAMAAAVWFKQVRDDDSMRKMHEIKFRSLRKLGELLQSRLDLSVRGTEGQLVKLIRANKEKIVPIEMTDNDIKQAMRAANLSTDKFEKAVQRHMDTGSIAGLLGTHGYARRDRELHEEVDEQELTRVIEQEERAKQLGEQAVADLADDTVGLTLIRTHRRPMRSFTLLLKLETHEQLRLAAFERHLTMHEVIRRGLDMWFTAQGLPPIANHSIERPEDDRKTA